MAKRNKRESVNQQIAKLMLKEIDALKIAHGAVTDEQLSEITDAYLVLTLSVNAEAY